MHIIVTTVSRLIVGGLCYTVPDLVCSRADSQPFTFTAGLQQHVACRDLRQHHEFARVLGLGGKHYVDYHPNARNPKLRLEQDDYVNFGRERTACLPPLHTSTIVRMSIHTEAFAICVAIRWLTALLIPYHGTGMIACNPKVAASALHFQSGCGTDTHDVNWSLVLSFSTVLSDLGDMSGVSSAEGPMERVYIDAQSSTVKFCPGDRTHFEVLLRQGLTDLGALNSFLAHERHAEFADFVVLTPAQSGRAVT